MSVRNLTNTSGGSVSKASIGLGNVENFSKSQLLASPTLTGDTTVTGNLTVQGITTSVQTQTVADNKITLNNGETGAGVTAGIAGILVDRGTLPDYRFIFQESNQTFRAGEIGSEQALATREDIPSDGSVPVWDAATSRLRTDIGLTASEVTQLKNINDQIISTVSWQYVAMMNQDVSTGSTPSLFSLTLRADSSAISFDDGSGQILSITSAPRLSSGEYNIPDAGTFADFVMTQGAQVINGDKRFNNTVVSVDGFAIQKGETAVPVASPELVQMLIEYPLQTGASTLAGTTFYQGYIGHINKAAIITRIRYFIATGSSGVMNICIYQRPTGSSANSAIGLATASLVAHVRHTEGVTGGNTVWLTSGTGILSPGVVYVLWARESGDHTYHTWANSANPALNGADVGAGFAPYSFTTATAASTEPLATFDPYNTGDVTATSDNNALILRLVVQDVS